MQYKITDMKLAQAREISTWQYPAPYRLYSLDGSEEVIQELTDGSYYSVVNDRGQLIGFFCYGQTACVPGGIKKGLYKECCTDIGLGMAPAWTGKGLGQEFLQVGMQFAQQHLKACCLRLTVAAFNKRAITVYTRSGFVKTAAFGCQTASGWMRFHIMKQIKEAGA